MATLILRPGDPQGLKAVAAALENEVKLSLTALAESKKFAPEVYPAFGSRNLVLVLPDGSMLSEPNAIASYLAGESDFSTESWMEWEAAVLRPAVYTGDSSAMAAALERLPASSNPQCFLSGNDAPGLPDFVVASTLRSAALLERPLSPGAKAYLEAVCAAPTVTAALEQVAIGKDDKAAASVVALDAAVLAASIPKLPVPGQRNILITSALPYVNNVPHLGNIIGCVLSADVYARFCRARGHNCIYVCGTDEYGTATETKALEEGLSCQEVCDKYHAIHRAIYDWFDISFDKFGRTPSRAQTAIGQEAFLELHANGYLVEQSMEQLFSEPLQKFLADRFVIGTCPKCRYEDARGDQCDACGTLLNPTELIDPKCKLTGTTPIVRQTRHVFLDLPRLSADLQAYIDDASARGGWSANCMQVTRAWMEQGLKIRCITRDLKWGTPVPLAGFEDKVFYVWFDAPIGYVSITAAYCGDAWRAWWLPAEHFGGDIIPDVELVQFMGKDNVPFHTVIFPASQLGTRRPWTMMRSISVTEYLNYEDGKFSKSRGIGVFGNDAKDTGIPVEVWRYYLLAVRPESSDAAFQWDDFAAKNNAELNDNLGNFINRTLKFVFARFDGGVPGGPSSQGGAAAESVNGLGEKVATFVEQYIEALEAQKLRTALQLAMSVSRAGNGFFQETEIWAKYKTDRPAAAACISACCGIVALLAALLQPFMPSFARKLLDQLALAEAPALSDDIIEKSKAIADILPAGHRIAAQEPTPLFRKIMDAEVAEFRARFAGSQNERATIESTSGDKATGKEKKANGAPQAASAGEGEGGKAKKGPKGSVTTAADGKVDGVKAGTPGGQVQGKGDRPVDVSRIDLRVGLIRKAWRHPDAESLYVEEIDVGEESGPRTVVSGLVKHIPEEQMQSRHVILVCNLKPANMRGVRSEAMVLAATSAEGKVELVEPPEGAQPGDRVFVAGFEGEPDAVLNPKKKVWEAVQPDLSTNAELQACYKGVPLSTDKGTCTVASVVGASIK